MDIAGCNGDLNIFWLCLALRYALQFIAFTRKLVALKPGVFAFPELFRHTHTHTHTHTADTSDFKPNTWGFLTAF